MNSNKRKVKLVVYGGSKDIKGMTFNKIYLNIVCALLIVILSTTVVTIRWGLSRNKVIEELASKLEESESKYNSAIAESNEKSLVIEELNSLLDELDVKIKNIEKSLNE